MAHYARRKGKESQRLAVAADIDAGLPKLTRKQEQFAKELLAGKTPREAYRLAYNCQGSSEATVIANSWKLSRNTQIALYIRTMQRIGLQESGITRDSHLAELTRLRELAVDAGQIAAGVQAEANRGKVAGFYVERVDIRHGLSDDAILAALAGLLGPELSMGLARAMKGETGLESPPLGSQSILNKPPLLENHSESGIDEE